MLRRLIPLLLASSALTGCAHLDTSPAASRPDVAAVATLLEGTFSSAEQAGAEPDDYFPIRLVMHRIWTERADAAWFYVEQAVGSALERPYRQRVYRVAPAEDGTVESRVFTIPEPPRFVASWNDPAVFQTIGPDDLTLRPGCSTFLAPEPDGRWTGGTRGTDCASTLAGAHHATSKVTLSPDLIVAWDQGWSAEGEQVWGPVPGPYEFRRVADGPPSE